MTNEKLLTIKEAAALISTRPHVVTVYKWCTVGMANGVKLRSVKIGGRRYIPLPALDEFVGILTNGPSAIPPLNEARAAAISAAERECVSLGI